MTGSQYELRQNQADSQVWGVYSSKTSTELLGLICVYVDDFLVLMPAGQVRTALVTQLRGIWTFGPERQLSPSVSITFLGIDWYMTKGGDVRLSQERFTLDLLSKYGMQGARPLSNITMEKLPEAEDPPNADQLRELQAYAGSFNWLATRTRAELAYWTSLLASTSTKHAGWSQRLAHKVLRYLSGTTDNAIVMKTTGSEDDLEVYTDAGFAGTDTHSQSGLAILWAGSLSTWRSSRASLSALSTAEAELCAAALGWQVAEGIRYFLLTLHIFPKRVVVWIDNTAALTSATLGATWRTRYYAVRAHRLLEEQSLHRISIKYCPTHDMVADALTKLATPSALQLLCRVMSGSSGDVRGRAAAVAMAAMDILA